MSTQRPEGMQLLQRGPAGPVELGDVAVLLHPSDHVAIAKQPLLPRTILKTADGEVKVEQMIPPGHKVALKAVAEGEPIRRYGQIIGFATQDVRPGQHVHSHNLAVGEGGLTLDYAFASEFKPVEFVPEDQRRTFMG